MDSERQNKKRVRRSGVPHLTISLVKHGGAISSHSCSPAVGDGNFLTVPSSRWPTTASALKSSASIYSQDSWRESPLILIESRINPRRFGLTISPSRDCPWLDALLPSAGLRTGVVSNRSSLTLVESREEGSKGKRASRRRNDVLESARVPKSARTSFGFGKVFPRLSLSQQRTADLNKALHSAVVIPVPLSTKHKNRFFVNDKNDARNGFTNAKRKYPWRLKRPPSPPVFRALPKIRSKRFFSPHPPHRSPKQLGRLVPQTPVEPPQIRIPLPSPDLKLDENFAIPIIQHTPSAQSPIHVSVHSPWKPRRPPSPRPRPARHRRDNSAPSLPLPPLPTVGRPETLHHVRKSTPSPSIRPLPGRQNAIAQFNQDVASQLSKRLKARASKTMQYAIHDGGIFSPTSS